jgi:hypothetical protein
VRRVLLPLSIAASLLTGCDQKSDAFSPGGGAGAAFDPMVFFNGHTHSWGVVENRSGAPNKWIVTDSQGSINEANQLRMVQHLTFQDGTAQERDWTLWRSGPGRFDATASDMVGTAKGEANGSMFHWQWVLARAPGNMLMDVTMNQWMYRLDDGSVMIRTTVSKFGFIAAEVSERFAHAEKG